MQEIGFRLTVTQVKKLSFNLDAISIHGGRPFKMSGQGLSCEPLKSLQQTGQQSQETEWGGGGILTFMENQLKPVPKMNVIKIQVTSIFIIFNFIL